MGLMPSRFWSLTVREFHIKYRAFIRMENRLEAMQIRQALRRGVGGDDSKGRQARSQLGKMANRLRQYPVKAWLKSR